MEEEKEVIENEVITDKMIEEIISEHFTDYEDDEEVTTEELEGLAVSIVELNEMYSQLENKQNKLIQELDELQLKLNKLEIVEEA